MLVGVTESLDWARRMQGKGLVWDRLAIDWPEMMAFKRSFTDVMPGRIERGLEEAGVETLHGTAAFTGPNEVRIGDRRIKARHIHVATGARPRTLDIPGEELVSTSTDFLELQSLPDRVVFIGGGLISFEFAHIARRAGASYVAVLHRGERPLERFDPEIVELLVERTRVLGVDVQLRTSVTAVEVRAGELVVAYETEEGVQALECDLVVHGAGRVPDLDDLCLEAAGIDAGPRGIAVKPSMRSVSNPAVFAVGDCADTGAPKLTPMSSLQARVASENLLAGEDVQNVSYPPIPRVVFTVPPVASVGMLEAEARDAGLEVDVHHRRTGSWYSSLRVAEPHAAYKVLIEKATRRVVGAHLIGPGAEEQINFFAMALGAGITADQLEDVVFAYPSFASEMASMVRP
jgi:glutathione reductase (NADPH)